MTTHTYLQSISIDKSPPFRDFECQFKMFQNQPYYQLFFQQLYRSGKFIAKILHKISTNKTLKLLLFGWCMWYVFLFWELLSKSQLPVLPLTLTSKKLKLIKNTCYQQEYFITCRIDWVGASSSCIFQSLSTLQLVLCMSPGTKERVEKLASFLLDFTEYQISTLS